MSEIVSPYPKPRKIVTFPKLRILRSVRRNIIKRMYRPLVFERYAPIHHYGIKIVINNDPAGVVPDLILKGVNNPTIAADRLVLRQATRKEGERPALHPDETSPFNVFENRQLSWTECPS